MKVNQQQIVDINFLFPDGKMKPHPAIIVSNEELYDAEGFFYCVLISTKDYNKEYVFELEDYMLTKPLNRKSYVKCHLIAGNTERDIVKTYGYVKPEYFQQIKSKIIQSIF